MEIIEDQLYSNQIRKYRINWKRLDEALMSLYPALLGSLRFESRWSKIF
jgi:hypothetical protein